MSWFRGVISIGDDTSGRPVEVYRRDIRDYAADIKMAQNRVLTAEATLR